MIATLPEAVSASKATPCSNWSETAALVLRAQAGDRDAFGALAEQYQRTVYALCLHRLGNASEAAEMTQDVFLHVLNRLGQLREPERFAGWLRQVAVRLSINRATRRVPPLAVDDEVLEGACPPARGAEPLTELIARERSQRVWAALARLKPIDREVLLACYFQGHPLNEIAENLGVPVGTVKRRLHTARLRLKDLLEAEVTDAHEWSDPAPAFATASY